MDDKTRRGLQRYLPLLLIPLGLLLYSNVLGAPFVYDDEGYVAANLQITSLSNFLDFSGTRYVGFLSFALNYAAGGLVPFDFHLTNIAIHIANALLVYALVSTVFRTPAMKGAGEGGVAVLVAFTAAIIFLSHPIESQAVSYVTQRFTSLCAFFYLLAILLYANSRLAREEGKGWLARYMGSLAATVLAMKTKEISFTIPFMIVLFDLVFFGDGFRKGKWLRVPFYLTLIIIPLSVLGPDIGLSVAHDTNAEHLRSLQVRDIGKLSKITYLLTEFRVVVTYLRLLFFPVNQTLEYDYPLSQSIFEPATLLSLIFLLSIALLGAYALFKSKKGGSHWGALFSFGIFWFFLALSVESTIIPIQDVIYEHRVYLPGIGIIISFTAAFFYAMDRVSSRRGREVSRAVAAAVLLIIVCPVLFTTLYLRNRVWTDEMALVTDSISKAPGKTRLYYARGLLYLKKGGYWEALSDANEILIREPMVAEAHNLKGVAYSGLGDHESSVRSFSTALSLNPNYEVVYLNRAISYSATGRHKEALNDLSRAAEVYPGFSEFMRSRTAGEAFGDLIKKCKGERLPGCKHLIPFQQSTGY
ncbi:MAG: hypothetical protein HYV24_03750 [Deltaproteobacteria bacterium]|nr:hypothetical protein [Deltaproteobacteria bacterium]